MHKCAKVRQCFRIAVRNKFENDVPSDIVRRMYQGVLYFQIVTLFRGTRERNLIYASKNSTSSHASVCPKNPELQNVARCTFLTLNFNQIGQQDSYLAVQSAACTTPVCRKRGEARRGETLQYRICVSVS